MAISKSSQRTTWRLSAGERRAILIIGDILASSIALLVSLYFWAQKDAWLNFSWEFLKERPPGWFYLLPFIWVLLMVELYDVRRASRRTDTIKGILIAAVISAILYLLVYFSSEPNSLPRRGVAIFLVANTVLTFIWRLIYIQVFTAPVFLRQVLVIGAGKAGSTLVSMLKDIHPLPFKLIGYIDDDAKKQGKRIEDHPVLGGSKNLFEIIRKENVTDLIFAISGEMEPEMFQVLLEAEERGIEISTMARVYEDLVNRIPIFLLQSDWLLRSFVDQSHTSGFYEVIKRLIDLFCALIGALIFILITPIISLAILLDNGTPIFFKQKRVGKFGQEYEIIKFRTMHRDAEMDGKARMATENDERVTRLGRFLRKSHLDEFPQFLNVLRGEMSMVGPRAERPEFVDHLQTRIPFYRARLFVKPGVTGWAQINQRYASNIEETGVKLEYDLYYIKHQNLLLDIFILLRTIGLVFGLKGL
jgi:exopolysaccharide biosynthesis polyprenyl glycosylphosphotransferase